MSRPILIDTSAIIALLSRNDPHHMACAAAIEEIEAPLLTCWPIMTEAAYLLQSRGAPTAPLFRAFSGGLFKMLPIIESELPTIESVMRKYQNLKLQLADACLAHLAAREKIGTIFTLDRRDFSIIRIGRKALRMLPK